MATTITTSTSLAATVGRRMVAVDSSGRTWVARYSVANARYEFWYSSNRVTWTEATSLRRAALSPVAACFYVNPVTDHAVFIVSDGSSASRYRAIPISPIASWIITGSMNSSSGTAVACVTYVVNGKRIEAWATAYNSSGTHRDLFAVTEFTNETGSTAARSLSTSAAESMMASVNAVSVDLDFRHTGDGGTAATTDPSMFMVASSSGQGTKFRKLTFSTSKLFTLGAARTLDAASHANSDVLSLAFDGTRSVVAFADSASTAAVKVYERDAGDTATTARTPPALGDGVVKSVSVGYDNNANLRVYAVGETSDDVKVVSYSRAGGTWGAWVTIEAADVLADSMSVMRGNTGSGIDVVWSSGASSPYSIQHERDALNNAPTAATWASPPDNAAADVGAPLALGWHFNDPDAGDTQSAYAMSRTIAGVTTYWNAGTSSWGASETKNTSAVSGVLLAAGWAADGDSVGFKGKTWDAANVEGVYSSSLTVHGSTPSPPSITAPADGGTIPTNKVTAAWTVAEQSSRRLRILTAAGSQLFDVGKHPSTDTSAELDYVLTNGVTYQLEVRTWNDDDLEANPDTHTFTVDFVEPAVPAYVATADPTNGRIALAITDPDPSGAQPTVTSHHVFVRVAADGRQDGERTVNDDGIRLATDIAPNSIFYDLAAGSITRYEYRTLAIADNGTSVYGPWTEATIEVPQGLFYGGSY